MERETATRQEIIEASKDIVDEYQADGIKLTIRQLYYQLVSKHVIPNMQKEYKRTVAAMTTARRAGDVPYDAFEDRSRESAGEQSRGETEADYVEDMIKREVRNARLYVGRSRWYGQPEYVEVWVEKQALQGIFENALQGLDVPLQVCKGYPSLSLLNDAQDRIRDGRTEDTPIILYFGDYDPSGEDIPRSIEENLLADFSLNVRVEKLAISVEQIAEYNIPPFPAKTSDSRYARFVADTGGDDAVELDALEPKVLKRLIQEAVAAHFETAIHKEEVLAWNTQEKAKVPAHIKKAIKELFDEWDAGKDDEDDDDNVDCSDCGGSHPKDESHKCEDCGDWVCDACSMHHDDDNVCQSCYDDRIEDEQRTEDEEDEEED